MPVYSRSKQDYINNSYKQPFQCTLNMHLKLGAILSQTYKDMTLYPQMYQNVYCNLLQKNFSIQELALYKRLLLEKYSECFYMFVAILKATNSSLQKGMTFCRSIYVKKVMKLHAFIFEQPSYTVTLQQCKLWDILIVLIVFNCDI